MKTQHTPGPWKVQLVAPQSQFERRYIHQIVGNCSAIASDLVCTLPDYSKDNEANAALIASAPDLSRQLADAKDRIARLENILRDILLQADTTGGQMRQIHRYDVDRIRQILP